MIMWRKQKKEEKLIYKQKRLKDIMIQIDTKIQI